MTTFRPETRTSTERTRSPSDCWICFSTRRFTTASAAGSERGSTVMELFGLPGFSAEPVEPSIRPSIVDEPREAAGLGPGDASLDRAAEAPGLVPLLLEGLGAGAFSGSASAGRSSGMGSRVSGMMTLGAAA